MGSTTLQVVVDAVIAVVVVRGGIIGLSTAPQVVVDVVVAVVVFRGGIIGLSMALHYRL